MEKEPMRPNRVLRIATVSATAVMSHAASASIDSCTWLPSGSGMNGEVLALTVYDGSGAPALYAGGWFTGAGGVTAQRVARWNGTAWSPLAEQGADWVVQALAVFDPGDGASLYAGGGFTSIGGVTAWNIARWDGVAWSSFGSSTPSGAVSALATISFDGHTRLYAGGGFSSAGFVQLNRIGAWDGETWHPLGTGMDGFVRAIALFDDGSGPAIYAGGSFATAGGITVNGIARWNGSAWSALGSGVTGEAVEVRALKVFDDGSGPALYAAGKFASAGGVEAFHIARWDGATWSAVGSVPLQGSIEAMEVFDDGRGPALYIGGFFGTLEWPSIQYLARLNGTQWSPVGAGIAGGSVNAFRAWDDGGGPTLHVGGNFNQAGGSFAFRIARWRCEEQGLPDPDLDGDGTVDGADLGILLNAWGPCDDCSADLNGDGVVDGADLGILLNAWG